MNRTKAYGAAFIGVIVLGVIAFLVTEHYRTKDFAPDLQKAAQVHQAEKKQEARSAQVDTVVKYLYVKEKAAARSADSGSSVADTLLQHAVSLRDSAEMWHLRFEAKDLALAFERSARVDADARADWLLVDRNAWKAQAISADSVNERLARDLGKAQDGCRILPFIRCPSRKEALVGGIVGGVLAVKYGRAILKAVIP